MRSSLTPISDLIRVFFCMVTPPSEGRIQRQALRFVPHAAGDRYARAIGVSESLVV